jgi:hypothetical protein
MICFSCLEEKKIYSILTGGSLVPNKLITEVTQNDALKAKTRVLSFRRTPESIFLVYFSRWMPAFAGMTSLLFMFCVTSVNHASAFTEIVNI